MPRARTLAALLAASLLAASAVSRADGAADEADLHFQLGAERYQAGDFRGALVEFFASNRLVANRNVVFNIARTYEQLRQFDEAYRYYVDALEGETDARIRHEVETAARRIEPNVAILQVETTPPGATIYINRRDLGSRGRSPRPLALDPGNYTLILERPGYEAVTISNVTLRVGQRTRISTPMTLIVGEVHVGGTAGAQVRVDDERAEPQCTVPCDAVIPPGSHVLYITGDGYTTQARPVAVAARERAEITANLQPVTGAIVVGADEQGALVEVDGHAVGFTPTVVQGVAVGQHRVRVSGTGFSAVERVVRVEPNRQTDLQSIELIPVREVNAASRTTENVEDAPSSVTIIDGREIRAMGYPTIAEALRGVRDVYVSFDGVYASAGIRGIGQPNDYGNRLLVLSDGVTLNDNVLGSSYIGYDGRVDLEDVERIEVVRGPGSVLYGTGALSGVVNLVMRGRESQQGISGGMSSYEDAVSRARVRGHVNFGEDGGAWISASGALSQGHSYTLDNTRGMPGETTTVNGVDRFQAGTVSGRAWYGALNAQWMLTTRHIDIPHGAYGTLLDDRTQYTDTRGMAEVRYEPRFGDNTQVLARAYANFYTFGGTNSYQPAPTHAEVEHYTGVWFGGEARLTGTIYRWLRLNGGVEFQYHPTIQLVGERPDQTDPAARYFLDRRVGDQTENHPLIVGAAYALAEANPRPWVRASLGVRLDVFDYMNTALQTNGSFQTGTFAVFTSVNPRAAVIVKPVEGLVIKLIAGRAFRAPSVYEFFYRDGSGGQVRSDAGGRTLGPEQVLSGEAEVSYRFFNDWVALLSGYVAQVDGIIQTVNVDFNGMSSSQYQNTGTALAYGADAEIRREWRQGWMLSAMAGYLQENLVGNVNAASLANDTTVVNVPHFLASLRGVAPLVRGLVNLGTRVTLEAPRRISYAVASSAPGGSTPPAVIADATISGTAPRLGIHYVVGVYNLFDYRWAVPVSGSFYQNTQPQLGRTFMLSLSTSF